MRVSVIPGSPCTFNIPSQRRSQPGICRRAQHCPWQQLGPVRDYPEMCSFVFEEPLVCCPHGLDAILFPDSSLWGSASSPSPPALPPSAAQPLPTAPTPRPTPAAPGPGGPPGPPLTNGVGDTARRKCVEYEQYALKKRYGPEADCVPNHRYPIGGNPALATEFAHMALLGFGDQPNISFECGGSLISKIWVLTAAHCLQSRVSATSVSWVLLGDLVRSVDTDNAYPQLIPVQRRLPHPGFKLPEYYNDIALLRLAWEPNITTGHVRPACLHVDRELKQEKLYLTGWGHTEFGGEPADALMEVALYRTKYDDCRKWYDGDAVSSAMPRGVDNDTQICAGQGQLKEDACNGDSGGPLQTPVIKPMCMYKIAGVVSLGQGCGFGAAGIYTRVSTYVSWIESIVWPDP